MNSQHFYLGNLKNIHFLSLIKGKLSNELVFVGPVLFLDKYFVTYKKKSSNNF